MSETETIATEVHQRDPDEVWSTNHRRSRQFGALAAALAKAQGGFSVIKRENTASVVSKKGDGSSYKYKYAELGDFLDMARKPLADAGLAVLQIPTFDGKVVCVETILVHGESGQWIANDFYLAPSSDRPQEVGSAVTYARRYSYTAILGMISEREDDDGNKAAGRQAAFTRGQESWGGDDGYESPVPSPSKPAPAAPRIAPAPSPALHPDIAAAEAALAKTIADFPSRADEARAEHSQAAGNATFALDRMRRLYARFAHEANPSRVDTGRATGRIAAVLSAIRRDFPARAAEAEALVKEYGSLAALGPADLAALTSALEGIYNAATEAA